MAMRLRRNGLMRKTGAKLSAEKIRRKMAMPEQVPRHRWWNELSYSSMV